jgi:prenyltransferase beta subunit
MSMAASAAEKEPGKTAAELITPAADKAVKKGLEYLASQQNEDGSIGKEPYRSNVGVCGLCGLAFVASGSTPGRGPLGKNIDRCLDYILSNNEPSGLLASPAGTKQWPMYGHGFATLFIAECDGMSRRPELRDRLTKAVKLIVSTQNKEGGWRYEAERASAADISVTVCQVMALRAARNAGVRVPSDAIDRAVEYVKQCQNEDGGFRYMIKEGDSAFPRSAAALTALCGAGIYEGDEISKGMDYLMQFIPERGTRREMTYYEYGQYYAAQAVWMIGGKNWPKWYAAMRDDLISRQEANGSWSSSYGPEYATAACCIALQVPNNSLPILQR